MRSLLYSVTAIPLLAASVMLPASTAHAAPEPLLYGELTPEGDFSTAPPNTTWWSSTGTGADYTGGTLKTSVGTEKLEPYHAMLGRNGVRLREGALYTLSFDARSSAPADIVASVQQPSGDFTAPLSRKITLDATNRRFQWTFRSTIDTTAGEGGQITFQLGAQTEPRSFTFDNVSLTTSTPREGFFVDPKSNAQNWLDAPPDPAVPVGTLDREKIRTGVAGRMTVKWFGGWNTDVRAAVDQYVTWAADAGQVPTLVAYNIPGRDCGGASGGGAEDAKRYKEWMDGFIAGIGKRPAIVILEPDAVAQADVEQNCLTPEQREARFDMLWYANQHLDAQGPYVKTYLDAGNATWTLGARRLDDPADKGIGLNDMTDLLGRSGIYLADGVALNVANYHSTDISNDYGRRLAARVKERLGVDTTWVVDTSRNGNGAYRIPGDETSGEVGFCNPPLRKLGSPARIGEGGAAFYLWIKNPGDSDGRYEDDRRCSSTGPQVQAGHFSPEFALRLIDGR
ncbi:glycoside hydrolase family 6 protein [Streptomyces sp. V2I9]|uniref:glycoside hydrolase family 6 protein n=1 Tax=Streptomyces sp. V2I9 TaxID=3042304 RepID=UPI0027896CF4|nr:glycoside hydrolase family 6 protein [Streptomyces sp. V2I9]MDQ0987179.1 endoglucanase [Streptomyces sp. V2I9]